MFFKREVLDLLRDSIGSALLEIVHPLHNIIVFFELLLKEGVNIADVYHPKMINIGKCYSPEEKEAAKLLFIEYQDVFT